MIFVTVGTQLPFDRLVKKVDEWAGLRGKTVFAQIGPTEWNPENIEGVPFMTPAEFEDRFRSAQAIVSHAGMGTILTALELGKPILVMPRRADLHEHRTDHQVATAAKLREKKGILVAENENELFEKLDALERLVQPERIPPHASEELIQAIRDFIND